MEWLDHTLAMYWWGLYLGFLIAPFIQEDAAVVGAAAASSAGGGDSLWLFAAILAGLTLSDLWKYWAGRAARTHRWARRYAEKPSVLAVRERIVNRLGLTLLTVRFVPGTRIPFYVASGFFKAPFALFAVFVTLSAALYVAVAFVLFHLLGMALGEQVKQLLPVAAILLVLGLVAWHGFRRRGAAASA